MSGGTDPERPTRSVSWNPPQVSDNAELHDASAKPTVVKSPANLVSPHNFQPGVTRITYTATDKSGNEASCVFTVTVVGMQEIIPCLHTISEHEALAKRSHKSMLVDWSLQNQNLRTDL